MFLAYISTSINFEKKLLFKVLHSFVYFERHIISNENLLTNRTSAANSSRLCILLFFLFLTNIGACFSKSSICIKIFEILS